MPRAANTNPDLAMNMDCVSARFAPDGRFLMVENSDDFPIVVVQNWPVELARLVR